MRTLITAEISSNHGGDMALAKQFINLAAKVRIDYVKFQSWQVSHLRDGRSDPQYSWFSQAELSDEAHVELIAECKRSGVKFLTTLFHSDRAEFLYSLGLTEIKIGSAEAGNVNVLRAARKFFKHIIVSVGLSRPKEILNTLEVLEGVDVTLCHSVSLYPTRPECANMDRIEWLRTLTEKVGYSDHTIGLDAAKLAIAKRVHYLEKHVCLSREGPGRVCPWDATIDEMERLTDYARKVDSLCLSSGENCEIDLDTARKFFIGRFRDFERSS